MIIKVVLIAGVLVAAGIVVRSRATATHQMLRRLGALVFVTLGALAVLFPDSVTNIAQTLGVGRGADLLLYLTVIAFILASLGMYRRHHELEVKVTRLTREIALRDALESNPGRPESDRR